MGLAFEVVDGKTWSYRFHDCGTLYAVLGRVARTDTLMWRWNPEDQAVEISSSDAPSQWNSMGKGDFGRRFADAYRQYVGKLVAT